MEALPSTGVVVVIRTGPSVRDEYIWEVTFVATPGAFPVGAGDRTNIIPDFTLLTGANSKVTVTTITEGGTSMDGMFQLGVGITDTRPISVFASAEEMKMVLEEVVGGRVQVSKIITSDGFLWLVTFVDQGDVTLLTPKPLSLISATVDIDEMISGTNPIITTSTTDMSDGPPYQMSLSDLSPGTSYYARIMFQNAVGLGKSTFPIPTSVITTYQPPGAPTRVTLDSSTRTSLTLSWQPPTQNGGVPISGYQLWIAVDDGGEGVYRLVYDRPNDSMTRTTTLTTAADDGLATGRRVRVKTRAITFCHPHTPTTACYGPFSPVARYTVRDPVVPLHPSNLIRDASTGVNPTLANEGVMVVRWSVPLDNGGDRVTGYQVMVDDVQSATVTTLSFTLSHCVDGKLYRIRVRSVNSIGVSSLSPTLSIVMADRPSAPSAPVLTDLSPTTITLQWPPLSAIDSNSGPVVGYKIWMFPSTSVSYPEVQRITSSVAAPISCIQQIKIVDASGQFSVYLNEQTSPLISVSATTTTLKTALQATGIGSVVVSSSGTSSWMVTFTGYVGALPPMILLTSQLTNALASKAYSTSVNIIQQGTSGLGGEFTLSFRGFETDFLSVSSTADDVRLGLMNLPSIGVANVIASTLSNGAKSWDVTFVTELGNVPSLQVTTGRLTGDKATIHVITIQEGTDGFVTYDGSTHPDITSTTINQMVPDVVHVFKVLAVNVVGEGIPSISTIPIAISLTADPMFTSAYGVSLTHGMSIGQNDDPSVNSFFIAPRSSVNNVITYATLPSLFQGQDIFWTELWTSPETVVDGTHTIAENELGRQAEYLPPVYDTQILKVDATQGIFQVELDTSDRLDGSVQKSPQALDVATLWSSSVETSCLLFQQLLESLANVVSVIVTREDTEVGVMTFTVSFLNPLCALPVLKINGDVTFVNTMTYPLVFSKQSDGICEVQTISSSAEVEFTSMITSLQTWVQNGETIGGTFTLSLNGVETIQMGVSSTSETLTSLFKDLSSIDDVIITRQSADYGTTSGLFTWLITFLDLDGAHPDLRMVASTMTGVGATVMINQIQAPSLSLSGTFVVSYKDATTPSLPFDIDAISLKKALETLPTIDTVNVLKQERFNGFRWTVSFTGDRGNLFLMEASPVTYAIQQLELIGGSPTPLHGSFRLLFQEEMTSSIPYNATAEEMMTSLQSISTVGRVDVTRSDRLDTGNRFQWEITFRSKLGDVPLLIADTSLLTGSYPDIQIRTLQSGNMQSLTGNSPQLMTHQQTTGRPYYVNAYSPRQAGQYVVGVQQLRPGGLNALYYDNYWLQQDPLIQQVDPELAFDWKDDAITVYGRDYISIRWFGKLKVPYDDDYVIYVTSSEGVRVWINHVLKVDTWETGEQEGGTFATIPLQLMTSTFHDLRIEYHEATGHASFQLQWSSSRLSLQTIASSFLYSADHVMQSPFPITVSPGPTAASTTTVSGIGLRTAMAGMTSSFLIQAKDQNQNNQTNSEDVFTITLELNGVFTPVTNPVYLGVGQYYITYIPAISGPYTLTIKYDDVNIVDSPFTVNVVPGPTTPHTSQALGQLLTSSMDGLTEAIAGQTTNFTIQARDTYGNPRVGLSSNDSFSTLMTSLQNPAIQFRTSFGLGDSTSGMYHVQYSIPTAGTYQMMTYLHQNPILMCPDNVCLGLGTFSTLKVVHSSLHPKSCTIDDLGSLGLSKAISNQETSFTIYSRDAFGNLRTGDRTTHSPSTGDGQSDTFLITLSSDKETITTSSAVQWITSTDIPSAGTFMLTYGKFRRSLCTECVLSLVNDVITVDMDLVGWLGIGQQFVVQKCVFTTVQVTITTIQVMTNHHCSPFTHQKRPLKIASSSSTSLFTVVLEHDVNASGLQTALEDLHSGKVAVTRTVSVTNAYIWKITFLSHLNYWSVASLAVWYPDNEVNLMQLTSTASGGVYPIRYTLTYSGEYNLTITSSSQPLFDQPLVVIVRDDVIDGSSCMVQMEEDVSTTAGEVYEFPIQLADRRRLEQQAVQLRAVALMTQYEVQKILMTSSSLTVGFRGSSTITLSALNDYATVKTNLESLSTISLDGITVSPAPENPLDTQLITNHRFLITFTKELGDLPLLQVTGGTITPVTSGVTAVRSEIQTLTCQGPGFPASTDIFTITYAGQSVTIKANDVISTLATQLTALMGDTVSVTQENPSQSKVCATSPSRLFITFERVWGDISGIQMQVPLTSSVILNYQENYVNGVYPVWGTFQLGFGKEMTSTLSFDSSDSEIRTELMTLSSIDDVIITRDWFEIRELTPTTRDVLISQWTVLFLHHNGDQPLLTVDTSGLKSTSPKL